jgi:hypothetical protein
MVIATDRALEEERNARRSEIDSSFHDAANGT